MINTGENKGSNYKEILKANSILIVTDVNTDNKDEVFNIFGNSTVYTDKKFDMPITNNEIISGRSKTIAKVNAKLASLQDDIINHKSSMFASESQFRNFKVKILFWCSEQFNNAIKALDNNEKCIISIYNTPSKHEIIFIEWLAEFGASVLIVSSEVSISEKPEFKVNKINLDTDEHIEYIAGNLKSNTIPTECKYNSLRELESALYEKDDIVKIIVSGTDNYDDTCNFYGKLYIESKKNTGLVLITNGFDKPSYEATSKIPRLPVNKTNYIIETLSGFISIAQSELCTEIKNCVKAEFNSAKYNGINAQQLYNKMVYTICVINELFKSHSSIKKIAYYGVPNSNDLIVLSILYRIMYVSILIICSDKSKTPSVDNIGTLELSNSTEIFPIPMVDKRDGAFTMAAQAQGVVERTLFSGDTLGMYKPGQFRKCNVIPFNTTYDEIKLWWNKEMFMRPGFEAHGDTVTIPTIFRVIKGVREGTDYFNEVQQYCCGKTLICKDISGLRILFNSNNVMMNHNIDVKGTLYKEQKPFFKNGKLDRKAIKNSKNYSYRILEDRKQEQILDAIEDTIINDKVNKDTFESDEKFIDTVLMIGLNMTPKLINIIQWFEYYTYNPNIILTLNDMKVTDATDMIILNIIQNLGFDVLIFVPTCYSTIENCAGNKFLYSIDIVGEAMYNLETRDLTVSSNIEIEDNTQKKKVGFLQKLFNK